MSWLALVASTTLGSSAVAQLRASVRADLGCTGAGRWRLIVQSYAPEELDEQGRPTHGARPLGSAEHLYDSEELREGVSLEVVQLDEGPEATLIAWLEADDVEVELDALAARPAGDSWFGRAGHMAGRRQIELLPYSTGDGNSGRA